MTNKLIPGPPVFLTGITLIPIERIRIQSGSNTSAYWFNASKEAVAIVLCNPEGAHVINITNQPQSIDELILEVSELGEMINKYSTT